MRPKRIDINNHVIKLEKAKQTLYGPIYSLRAVELKTLKTYIKTYLAHGFIRLLKSPVDTQIFVSRKPNGNLHLCVNYQDLNTFTIKNWYLLFLIG